MKNVIKGLLLLLILAPLKVVSQEDCKENLAKAISYYEDGKLQLAEGLAINCVNSPSVTDRWQAHRLLALIYVANQNNEKAKESALQMLQINPKYKPSVFRDPPELVKLLKDITIIPNFSLGMAISAGSNITLPNVIKSYNVSDYTKTYQSQNNIQMSLSAGYQFSPHWAADAAILVMQKGYSIDYSMTNWSLFSKERFTYLNLPLAARYYLNYGKRIQPFAQAGVHVGYLLFSNQTLQANYLPTDKTFELANFSSTDRRNRWDYGVNFGLGLNYHTENGRFFASLTYIQGLRNITKTSERYKYDELIYSYYYLDDDIILANLSFGIGYALNISYKVYQKGVTK